MGKIDSLTDNPDYRNNDVLEIRDSCCHYAKVIRQNIVLFLRIINNGQGF